MSEAKVKILPEEGSGVCVGVEIELKRLTVTSPFLQVGDGPQRREASRPQKDAQCLPKPRFLQEGVPGAEDALLLQT